MKKNVKTLFILLLILSVSSCSEKEVPINGIKDSNVKNDYELRSANSSKGFGKGGKKKNQEEAEPQQTDTFIRAYRLYQADDHDPLYRFLFSESDTLVLLQTDPSVTDWGTDGRGIWADPYPYDAENSLVYYRKSLSEVTYDFDLLADDLVDVTKILITYPYLCSACSPDTTITHPGLYLLEE